MDNENQNNSENQHEIELNYIKSNNLRVVHADGAIGDGTPGGDLFLVFYSERFPLPDGQTFKINEEGRVVGEIFDKRKVKSNGIMREVEVGVVLDVEVAKVMIISLSRVIRQLESDETQCQKSEEAEQ